MTAAAVALAVVLAVLGWRLARRTPTPEADPNPLPEGDPYRTPAPEPEIGPLPREIPDDRLEGRLGALKSEIGAELVPAMVDLVEELEVAMRDLRPPPPPPPRERND